MQRLMGLIVAAAHIVRLDTIGPLAGDIKLRRVFPGVPSAEEYWI